MSIKWILIFILVLLSNASWGQVQPLGGQAVSDLEAAAEQGDAAAQTRLARLYLFGPPATRDQQRALHWLRQAVDKRHAPAQYLLGMLLISDKRNATRMKEGTGYLSHAATNGCAGASGLLGNMFLAASSRDASIKPMAAMLIRQGAVGGDYMSQTLLAKLYSDGDQAIPQDLVASYAWLEFSLTDRPDHNLTKFSKDLQEKVRTKMTPDELQRADALAQTLRDKHGKDSYDFCSQSLPDELAN